MRTPAAPVGRLAPDNLPGVGLAHRIEGRGNPRWEGIVGRVVIVQGEADLLEIAGAMGAATRLASGLDRGNQEPDQDPDDSDDNYELDQGDPALRPSHCEVLLRRIQASRIGLSAL